MDDELEHIRARRMAEMRGSMPQGVNAQDNQKAVEEKKKAEDMKQSILSQILDQNARARLNTLIVGKPDKGQMVENLLIQMAQRGQIRGRMDEQELKSILERVSEQTHTQTKVKFDRRRAAIDSDDDLDLDV